MTSKLIKTYYSLWQEKPRVTSSEAGEAKEATKTYQKDHLLKIYNLINECNTGIGKTI